MTLLVVRLRVADIQELERNYSEREALKATFGCTASRLLVDGEDQHSALVLLEFPSEELARQYAVTSASFLGPKTPLAAITVISAKYFEDVPASSDDPVDDLSHPTAVSPVVT